MRRASLVTLGLAAAAAAASRAVHRASTAISTGPDRYDLRDLRRDPEGEEVRVERPDGTSVRCVVAGEGPDVVLTHGYGASLVEWNVVMPLLVAAGHRVVAVDWRGHGGTTIGADGVDPEVVAADHAAVLEALDVRDGVLVGHSTGGYLSLITLLEHPGAATRVAGLALLASLAGDAVVDAPQTRLQIPLITSGVMSRVAASPTLGPLFGASIWGPDPSPAALQVFLEVFQTVDHDAVVPLLKRLAHTSVYDRLGDITVPTVVVVGEEDATTPTWHSETMARDIPLARLVRVPQAGHMLNWQVPEVLVEAITSLVPATSD